MHHCTGILQNSFFLRKKEFGRKTFSITRFRKFCKPQVWNFFQKSLHHMFSWEFLEIFRTAILQDISGLTIPDNPFPQENMLLKLAEKSYLFRDGGPYHIETSVTKELNQPWETVFINMLFYNDFSVDGSRY